MSTPAERLAKIRELHSPVPVPEGQQWMGSNEPGAAPCAGCHTGDPFLDAQWPCETRQIADQDDGPRITVELPMWFCTFCREVAQVGVRPAYCPECGPKHDDCLIRLTVPYVSDDDQAVIDAGRVRHTRDMCERSIQHDVGAPGWSTTGGLTDRQWLAQSVLNIFDGTIDAQIRQEAGL